MSKKTDKQRVAGMRAGSELQNKLAKGATTDPAYLEAANSANIAVNAAAVDMMSEAHPPSFIANGMLFEAVKIMVSIAVCSTRDLGAVHDQIHVMVCDAFQVCVQVESIRQEDMRQKMEAWFSPPAGHA